MVTSSLEWVWPSQTRAGSQNRGNRARGYEILVCVQFAHTALTQDVDGDAVLAYLFVDTKLRRDKRWLTLSFSKEN